MNVLDRANVLLHRDTLTLGDLFETLAKVHGNRTVVTQPGEIPLELTYQQAAKRVRRWAGGVAARSAPGQAVVIAVPNSYEQFLLCAAVSRAGGVPVPVNSRMTNDEIQHVIGDSGASLVIRDVAEVDDGDPMVDAHPAASSDVAAMFYTSGTTGKPKGVELTHRSLVASAAGGVVFPSRLRHDEALISLPVAHIMGFAALLGLACTGIAVHFIPKFRPTDVLDAIETRRCSMYMGVPAMYRMLMEAGAEKRDLTSIRIWASGADVMPTELAKSFKKMGRSATLPGGLSIGQASFVEGYGMVELGGGAAVKASPPYLDLGLGDAVGVPIPGWKFRVVDDNDAEVRVGEVGELLVTGPGVTKGYHGDEAATKAAMTDDGWVRTGDLVRKGPMGVVLFAGRSKDVIKHGGYSVYAVEVESAIEEHPDVLEAAVVGVPDERLGERVAAAVRLEPGASVTPDALIAFAKERLSDYKVPSIVKVVDDLPRTGTEKVQRRLVRDLFDG